MRINEISVSVDRALPTFIKEWESFVKNFQTRGSDPTTTDFMNWFTNRFQGTGKTLTIPDISDLQQNTIKQYLRTALSKQIYTQDLWGKYPKKPAQQPQQPQAAATTPTTTAPAATPAATPPATPAATPLGPVAGQEIEMPGTNYKYKYSPSWTDAAGNPAPAAVANVLAQLATGTNLSDINFNDLKQARRSIGLTEAKKLRKKLK
jgi:pyruvate/2-oxoglutarate dehydrogenase complex dihydrolipoamide acyltransferase (E2) component